jgi:hypothetical protein
VYGKGEGVTVEVRLHYVSFISPKKHVRSSPFYMLLSNVCSLMESARFMLYS